MCESYMSEEGHMSMFAHTLYAALTQMIVVYCSSLHALLPQSTTLAAMFHAPSRRTAERGVQVCELAAKIDHWFEIRRSRHLQKLVARVKSEATWKTAPTVSGWLKLVWFGLQSLCFHTRTCISRPPIKLANETFDAFYSHVRKPCVHV